MLIDQENGNILPFCVILKSRFNHVRLRLYNGRTSAFPDPTHMMRE